MKSEIAERVNLSILNREFALSRMLWAMENQKNITAIVLNNGLSYENLVIVGRYSNTDKFIALTENKEKVEFQLDELNLIA